MKQLIILCLFMGSLLFGKSSIEIHGSSTLHDWVMKSQTMNVKVENQGDKLTKLSIAVMIDTLKSGNEDLDETAYETLKISRYNIITFDLISQNENGTITGVFKVVDYEKEATLKPDIIKDGQVTGSFKVKMSDFGLVPPSALFGMIKSADEVTIKYNIQQEKS